MAKKPKGWRSFEDCYDEIVIIVEKKRPEWKFKASVMTDFDDFKMQLLAHIWKKWPLYDQSRPLGAWVARTVRNRFINFLRDTYTSTSSPCLRCPCNLGGTACKLYGEQSVECNTFKAWYNKKRHSHNARLPVALENHLNEANSQPDTMVDLESAMANLHIHMEKKLTKKEWEIYQKIYIENKSDEEVAKELGLKTTEKGRKAGYKRIRMVQTIILAAAKEVIKEHGIETLR